MLSECGTLQEGSFLFKTLWVRVANHYQGESIKKNESDLKCLHSHYQEVPQACGGTVGVCGRECRRKGLWKFAK